MRTGVIVCRREKDDTLPDAIRAIDLEEWFDHEAIDYKRVGSGENINVQSCPFCGDDRWRVYFSRTKKLGICFHGSCPKKTFNLFSFAREHIGGDNASTAKGLIDFANGSGAIRLKAPAPVCEPVAADALTLPVSVPLPDATTPADAYLAARRVLPRTQELFGLRWSLAGTWPYEDVDGKPRQMSFAQRILIPVHDLDGTPKTFQGRDVTGLTDLRYLFPPSLPASGRFLYGGHLAVGAKHLVLSEGAFDTIATHQAIEGLSEFKDCAAIGSFGLSLSHSDATGDDQLGRLLRLKAAGAEVVTIMWDGEKNALAHALNAADLLHRQGFQVRLALLPPDADPGEVDTRVIRDTIANARPFSQTLRIEWMLRSPYK